MTFGYSSSGKLLFKIFAVLTFGSLAHDIYLWQSVEGRSFALADLGWITKHYAYDQHSAIVKALGVERFNALFTPVLSLPATVLTGGLSVLTIVIDYLLHPFRKGKLPPRYTDRKKF